MEQQWETKENTIKNAQEAKETQGETNRKTNKK